MARKGCELCTSPARMFCESDQANLCWDCDEKVHAANFLVAKHSRTLICHVCHSPTPWTASGLNLGPINSICHSCADGGVANRGGSTASSRRGNDGGGHDSAESESDGGEYFSDSEGLSEGEEGEGLSYYSYGSNAFESEGENTCCSFGNSDSNQRESDENVGCSSSSARPSKRRRVSNGGPSPEKTSDRRSSPGAAAMEKLRRFQQEIAKEGEETSAVTLRAY